MAEKRLRVAIYGRVSGEKQADEQTIETQVAGGENWCANRHADIVGYYLDNPCGNKVPLLKRKEGRRLIEDARAGRFDVVVVYMIDRWSRTRRVFYDGLDMLTEAGVGFVSATQEFETYTPSGRAFLSMLTTFAELDRDMIEQKLSDGKDNWVKQTYLAPDGEEYNFWSGARTPYGYRVIEVCRRSGLIVDEEPIEGLDFSPAQVVRWCYEWAVHERVSCAEIARRLNARRAPRCSYLNDGSKGRLRQPTGYNYWTPQNVSQLLRNPIYRGEHVFGLKSKRGRQPVPRRFPAIVTLVLWEQAREELIQRRTFPDRSAKHEYLLRGLIKCSHCGYNFVATARYGGGKEKPGRWHYVCQSKHDQRRTRWERDGLTCIAKPIRETVETLVWDDICAFLHNPSAALEKLRAQLNVTLGRSDQIQAEVLAERGNRDELRLREKRLVNLYTEGRVSDELYDARVAEIAEGVKATEARIATLEKLLENEQRVEGRLNSAAEFLRRMWERAEVTAEWTWAAKRTLVELWVRRVWVDPPTAPGEAPTVRIDYLFGQPAEHTAADET
jgi:site-specific DNA recombinase